MRRLAFALFVALSLTSCGSSPKTEFFALTAVAGSPAQRMAVKPIQVVSVHIPADLDRQEMVWRGQGQSLTVSDQNRWGAPLDEMIERVLTEDLASRLPRGSVVLPQQAAPQDSRTLVLDILEFEDDGNGKVVFDGSWSLTSRGASSPEAGETLKLSAPAKSGDAASEAQAMSTIVGQLADRIVAKIPR
ncbi:MAG TPA: PqiC family protein [Rhizomicrobium sp.]|nr:PqiC family protein [Rhizomicrobium sp.]